MKRISVTLLLAVLCFKFNYGQTPFFQNYFLLGKNEPVQVNTMFQDKTSFIWYGTNRGLFRFDGVKQKRITSTDSLPDENITAIAQDSSGRIWMGRKNGTLSYIEKGTIKKFNPLEGSATAQVSEIIFDSRGNLWFSTLGDGLYYYTEERLYRLDENEKMPDLNIYDITEDKQGNIWAGTDGGVAICTLHNKKVSIKTIDYSNGLPDNIIRKLVPGKDGTMWMGTEDAGIINYDPASGKIKSLIEGHWSYGEISDILFVENQVWISCFQKGLIVYDQKTRQIKLYDAKVGTGFTSVNTLLKDYEGSIWAGSMSGVIMRTLGDNVEFIETFDKVKNVNVVALAADKQGNLWYSNSEGLFRRRVDKSGIVFNEKQLVNTPFQKKTIISLYVDSDGYIWAGLFGEGVLRINAETGKIRLLYKEIQDGNILNISGRNHTVWLATLGGATQIKIAGDHLNIQNYSRKDGLISEYIYQVFIDSKNRAWFGTDGKGVDMLDEAGFHHYKEGLNSKVVYGFAEDGNHHIWANVQGNGIFQFDGSKFIPLSADARLHDNNVTCLTSDKFGNLIMMHDFGIDIYDVNKNKIRYLGDQVGIHDKKPNLNAVAKDNHDHIYLGTDAGIVVYSDRVNTGTSVPDPFIDGIKVLDQNIELSGNLRFNYDHNDVTINYLAFWFQNPDNINFQYKLENYDRDWIMSRNRFATYSSLPPGEYVFRLKASDSDEFNNMKETTFRFTIRPPFWRTTWFYILSVLEIILVVYSFIKFREKKLRNDKKILEAKNDELKKINTELDKFVYSVSHDLRAPLLSMQGVVDVTEEETTEELTSEHMKMLRASITRLDRFIAAILDYSRNSRSELNHDMIDISKLCSEIKNDMVYAGDEERVDIQVDIKQQGEFYTDNKRLEVVLTNLISNAVRYYNPETKNPYVKIKVNANEPVAMIEVEDNGIGIPVDYHEKVFEMFCRVSDNSNGSGLGLYIVKETVAKLKGAINIESQPGTGTKFTLTIPNMAFNN